MVGVIVQEAKIDQMQTALLVIGIFENERDLKSKGLNSTITAAIIELIENKEFKRSFGSNIIFHMMGKGLIKKIMLVGLGTREKFTYENARIIAGKAALKAKELGVEEFCILPFMDVDEALIEAISEGVLLSLYSFNRYMTSGNEATIPAQATIVINSDSAKFKEVVGNVSLVAQAVNYARDLSNLPPNECPPSQIASLALALAGEYGIKTRILERYEMESIGLNGIVSVGKGSNNPPKLIILEYYGNADHQNPYLLVGKAVTFDTGGISLKPGDKMDEMKFDKCGGCSVLGILKAIASLGLPINVIGIIPSVENMPSSGSYRPGDIIRMYNGKTVEILNTDAEGRIILADAIAYGVAIFNPQAIIDLATLTGACVIALGANVAAVIGTSKNLAERLSKISEKTGERIWDLPLYDEYYEQIKSTVADLKNIGGRPGGAITAAAFLSNFTNNIPWVHLDIAGTAWIQEGTFERSYNPKGATGFGIRTLVKFLMEAPNK